MTERRTRAALAVAHEDGKPVAEHPARRAKVALFANTDWYLYNFRLPLALRLREAGFEVLLISPGGPYAGRLVDHGFRWRELFMDRRSLDPVAEARLILRLCAILRQEKVDLVHGFTIKAAVYGALAGRLAGVRARLLAVAGLGHVFTSTSLRARALRPILSAILRLSATGARVILQNPDDRRLFLERRITRPERMRLIMGSGVDARRFSPDPRERRVGARFRVLLASRLLWSKGVDDFVAAAARLRDDGVAVEMLLAGQPDAGNPDAVPENVVRAWTADGLITWLGQVEDMPALLRSVDAFALPSRYGEGVPRGLIEAAACGLPLITTDTPGCRELVRHEVEGVHVPARRPEALAATIRTLIDQPEAARRMGAAARVRALTLFDERKVLDETLAVYAEALGVSMSMRPRRT